MTNALADLGADPVTHLVNTHWHFDHADGNEWLHSIGAKIIAQNNTKKHLSSIQRVEDWDYNFLPSPAGAIPSEVFENEKTQKLNGQTIELKHYAPAHTDSDISVMFSEANVLHTVTRFGTESIRLSIIRRAEASTGRSRPRKPILPGWLTIRSSFPATVSPSATKPNSKTPRTCL
jgi:Metallo-beta-lactamase superfamily